MSRKLSPQRVRFHQQHPASKISTRALASAIKTGGEFFSDGRSISLLRDSSTKRLNLLLAGGKDEVTGFVVQYAGRTYVAPDLADSFEQAIVFPGEPRDFGSTAVLFRGIKESIMNFGVPGQAALAASYFVLSSWFVEILPAAPFLLISGPRAEASLLLALLSCLVRHPLPLIEISAARLRSLPMNLHPTLLIDDELMPDPLFRLLSVSSNRNANIVITGGVTNAYGAKALYCGPLARDDSFGDAVMQIHLTLSDGMLPILNQKDRQDLAAKFQPSLLAYRVKNIVQVAAAQFNSQGLPRECQLLASLLAVCIVDAPELQAGVGSLLEAQHQQTRADRWGDLRCAVIEAILSRCHRRQNEGDVVHVGDIAADAAAILSGRGETAKLEPRAIGSILRDLGLNGRRDSRGYRFVLDDLFCYRIHKLAQQFDVATVQEGGLTTCADCRGNDLVRFRGA
jgi:hypothetical protein